MGDSEVIRILSLFVLLTLMCAIARQMSEMDMLPGYDPYFFGEGFKDAGQAPKKEAAIYGVPEDTGRFEPDQLNKFVLLEGRKLDQNTVDAVGTLTAEDHYKKDFAAQTMRTGNFIQRTNNYKQEAI
jgi:hypothetical protein